jgi:hypothetical protein
MNGLEKTLERKIPKGERCWQVSEESIVYEPNGESRFQGWPIAAD